MTYEQLAETGVDPAYPDPYSDTSTTAQNPLARFTNIAGAVVSVALVAGVGVWGYQLMVRDVSGIPIVRALDGEMRVRPEDPGGDLAQHQGLAVNEVAADGGASAPADRLVLAPQPVRLTDEDMPMDDEAVAIVQQAIADNQVIPGAEATEEETVVVDAKRISELAESGSVDELVAVLTEGTTPFENAVAIEGPEELLQVAAPVAPRDTVVDAPGVRVSMRPRLRPDRPAAQVVPAVATAPEPREIDADALPAGTRLVQLGAYDTKDIAVAEWAKFTAQFGDLMTDKDRVIQQASSGGRTFYRLRALGFEDLSAARRFCSALVAEGADCIPVVTR